MKTIADILKNLNPEQLSAVQEIEGPVMVVAGPGTGKTQILAARIANILHKTDTGAENILCLTYTDAGSIAMRSRLVDLIGNEAHRISIHTYHGFCHRVIQENPECFNYKSLEPISSLESFELMHSLVIELEEEHPLKKMKGNVTYLTKALHTVFDWMKKEGYTPEAIEKEAAEIKEAFRSDEAYIYKRKTGDFKKGDLNISKLEKEDKRLDDLVAAGHLYFRYQSMMTDMARYDYSDMLLWVVDLFKINNNVLASYQERFQYILADEFQDNSGIQNEILNLLISYWEIPNVFVVGDDDQSIYKFQGAEIKNIVHFKNKYEHHLKTIVLKSNYRSSQPILDAAKALISNNKNRLVNQLPNLSKDLTSNLLKNAEKVQVQAYKNAYHEAIGIANQIKKSIASGVAPNEIAVLYSKHSFGELCAQVLKQDGIHVYLKKSEKISAAKSVRNLHLALNFLHLELKEPFSGESELFELLHAPNFKLSPLEIARFTNHMMYKNVNRLRWREYLQNKDELVKTFSEDLGMRLLKCGNWIEKMIAFAISEPVLRVTDQLISEMQLDQSVFSQSDFIFEMECLRTFVHFIQASSDLSLEMVMHKLDLMSSYKIDLQKEHLVFDADGVNFLSAHGSKGLEFEEVYILNCTEEGWEKKRDVALPYGMKYFIDNEADVNHEERRRLFYVAMTRAKTKLVLSHLNEKISDSSKMLARSLFVDEVMQDELAKNVKIELDALSVSDCIKRISYNPVLRTENIMEPTFLDEYLTGYQLSVSHLNNYLKCPTAFYFQNILRVPSAKNKYFSFGLAVHSALDQLIQLRSENASLFTRTKLLEFYENALWRERFVFNERAYEEFLSLGKELLAGYFDSNNERWLMIKDMQTEVKIDRIEVDGVPIKGQLDRLDLEGNSVAVVDYKTGDANNGKSKVNPPKNLVFDAKNSDLADVGGDYWRQIMFYGLLVNGDRTKNWQALSGQMDFIEPDKTGSLIQVKRMITSEAIDYMKGLVRAVYDKILHKEFSPGCQKEDCTWCQFVARNYTTHV